MVFSAEAKDLALPELMSVRGPEKVREPLRLLWVSAWTVDLGRLLCRG